MFWAQSYILTREAFVLYADMQKKREPARK